MKPNVTFYWLCGALLVASVVLNSCQHAPQNQAWQAQPETGLYQQTALLTAAAAAPKKPKPGRKPKTKADYESAIASVKQYRKVHEKGGMLNSYLSKQVVKDLIANSKCEGIRMYLADSAGQERMVVIGVDKDGMDLITPTTLEDKTGVKSQGKYLFGISEDRCPESCVGAILYE
jgi:hypothetical protein